MVRRPSLDEIPNEKEYLEEIKKIERMKQKQIKSEDESGDPANEDEVI